MTATSIVTAVVTSVITMHKARKKVIYMLDALEDKETNFRFDERGNSGRKFNKALNRLKTIFDKERQEIIEHERFYGNLLDHVSTGVAVIEEGNRSGCVIYHNKTALDILGIATFGNIKQLRSNGEALYEAFANVNQGHEKRTSWYNESGLQTIAVTASTTKINGTTVKITTFNDISNDMADSEQESWTKLIRVLTHEIMNTITPVASLSETLSDYIDSHDTDEKEERSVIKEGLETISRSSYSLIRFVDSYRSLTRIASPSKKVFSVKDLIERVFKLVEGEMAENGVELTFTEKSSDTLIYADEGQISQIIVNLIKNAVQAGARHIDITAETDMKENVILHISNDGSAISKESKEQIFVPFYTTKPEGTGIGLSISRQIMRLHNGNLMLTRSDDETTTFTLVFK